MKSQIEQIINDVVMALFSVPACVIATRPDAQFGDYTTNIAMTLTAQVGQNPRQIAEAIAEALRAYDEIIEKVEVAGPGFINITVQNTVLAGAMATSPSQVLAGQTVVAEYSDPNPFKVLHAGHLYTSVVGYAIANLLAKAGADVHRVNFGGDVGMHVAKTVWAILRALGGEEPIALNAIPEAERSTWLSQAYIAGNNAYEDDEVAKAEIILLNKRVYEVHLTDDRNSNFAQIYWTCRTWSYEYFDAFYARIGTEFEKYYPESKVADRGLAAVKENTGKVFEESDGAIVFKGEPYGLHTRVFINSQGLPTYEAKDVGLILAKETDYQFDRSIVITGNEQSQYMSVVLKAIEQFRPDLVEKTSHLTHGIVKLAGGVKMSSRKGNILRAVDVLDVADEANKAANGKNDTAVVLGAVKYAFLKVRVGGDIIYDPAESVALEGNSGPYLQYAHVRARSILRKTAVAPNELTITASERPLALKITEYNEVVDKAVAELMPHHVCTYLYELAQTFNRFYENNRVVGDSREAERITLVAAYADTLKDGLELLGMPVPEAM